MAEQHFVTEDIDAVMAEGLTVHAANGDKIGTVREYSNVAGYLVVQSGLIAHKDLYVPYSLIRSIDPREIYLSLNEDALTGDYSAPPPATVVVEGANAATLVPSGYDGQPAEFNRVNLETVRRNLARGMTVYTSSGEQIGKVDGIDDRAGYMLVKQHHFSKKDFFIPFAAISTVERAFGEVFLAVSKDVLVKDFARVPDGAVLRLDTALAPGIEAVVVEDN